MSMLQKTTWEIDELIDNKTEYTNQSNALPNTMSPDKTRIVILTVFL